MSDQPMREMRSDELVEAIERLSMYPRLIAERAYAEGLAAATPAPLDVDAPDNANAATTSANATPAPLDVERLADALPLGEPTMHAHDGLGIHRAEAHHRPEDYRP